MLYFYLNTIAVSKAHFDSPESFVCRQFKRKELKYDRTISY